MMEVHQAQDLVHILQVHKTEGFGFESHKLGFVHVVS